MFLPFGAIFLHRPKHTRPPCNHGRQPGRPSAPLLTCARRRTMTPGFSCEECGNHGPSLPTLPSPRPPPLPTKSRTATPSIPPAPHGDSPSHGLSVAATLARRRLRSSLARPLGGSGPSLAWHAGSAGSGPSALPPVARRKRRRRDVRPSLACRELRLLLLRMAAARCPCLPSHRPHTGPRASNHCSAGARSLAPLPDEPTRQQKQDAMELVRTRSNPSNLI
ncbi:hypothetical protein PVAP13_5KG781600 [Panicum virgatum]|uniref:Uncharacterized protein n=1 Tax=Panicum virgatum TaxID=38727 RepID=A0A8T0SVI5_PANVG|nr:hypothetical protein PVAP13_5KG781600 [Panicum virgatum]